MICHMKGAALCGISELKRIKKAWACYNLSEVESESGKKAHREEGNHHGRLLTSCGHIEYKCMLAIMKTKISLLKNRLSQIPNLCWTLSPLGPSTHQDHHNSLQSLLTCRPKYMSTFHFTTLPPLPCFEKLQALEITQLCPWLVCRL